MKANKLLIPILTGLLFAAAANAQEDITITGSTAARRIVYDRAAALFDAGATTVGIGGAPLSFSITANKVTISGTMSNAIPALGSTPVTLRFGMSGAAQGAVDLDQQNPVSTLDPITGNSSNQTALIAFFDQFPAATPVSTPATDFNANTNLMVLPLVFFKNPSGPDMATVTNMTKEQAIMLMSSSGTVGGFPAMPALFLGSTSATATNPVYLLGRDIGSGTRIGITKDIGFTGTPRQWTTNGANLVLASSVAGVANSGVVALDILGNPADGFSSGGTLCKVAASITAFNVIGYAGEPDAGSGNGITPANWLSYEGTACTHANVAAGLYPIWCYEHMFARKNSLSANQSLIFGALQSFMTDSTYQLTNPVFTNNAVALSQMIVKRGVDGGSFTTTPLAGW